MTSDAQRDEVVEVELRAAILKPHDVVNLQAFGRSAVVDGKPQVRGVRRNGDLIPLWPKLALERVVKEGMAAIADDPLAALPQEQQAGAILIDQAEYTARADTFKKHGRRAKWTDELLQEFADNYTKAQALAHPNLPRDLGYSERQIRDLVRRCKERGLL